VAVRVRPFELHPQVAARDRHSQRVTLVVTVGVSGAAVGLTNDFEERTHDRFGSGGKEATASTSARTFSIIGCYYLFFTHSQSFFFSGTSIVESLPCRTSAQRELAPICLDLGQRHRRIHPASYPDPRLPLPTFGFSSDPRRPRLHFGEAHHRRDSARVDRCTNRDRRTASRGSPSPPADLVKPVPIPSRAVAPRSSNPNNDVPFSQVYFRTLLRMKS